MAIELAPFGAPGCMLQNLPELVLPASRIGVFGTRRHGDQQQYRGRE